MGQMEPAAEPVDPLAHRGLVRFVMRRVGSADADLRQHLWAALCRAAPRYDPARGAKFSTYACYCLFGEAVRWRGTDGRGVVAGYAVRGADGRRRTVKRRAVLFSELGGDFVRGTAADLARTPDHAPAVDERLDAGWFAGRLLRVVSRQRRRAVELRFGFGGPRHTLAEAAVRMGVTRERVRQLVIGAIKDMRDEAATSPDLAGSTI